MRTRRLVGGGVIAALAGGALIASAIVGSGTAMAGEGPPPCDSTEIPTSTYTATIQPPSINAFQQIATCTPVKIKTHTPTATPTAAATETPVPSTPTNTAVPPTNTPTGGQEGAGVRPPNTGDGAGTAGSGTNMLLVTLGALLLVGGGGAVIAGSRKR